jgi:hypothetical protein
MRLFILAGMIGSTLSMLVITIDGLLRRRDFAISQAISDLGTRLHGWVLNKDLNPVYRRTPQNRNCRWNEWTTPEAERHGRKPRKPASRLGLKPRRLRRVTAVIRLPAGRHAVRRRGRRAA